MTDQNRLPGLQVARAVAALSIAYFHSWVALVRFPNGTSFPIPVLTGYGWLAVDLFFAISGYVICLVISRHPFNVVSFLTKRVLRLYPLWLLTLTTFALLAMAWRGPATHETLGYFLYSVTLLPTEHFPFYDIGWSLQHEMVFYFIAAITIPLFGIPGLAIFLCGSALANNMTELPWYLTNLATYHLEFLAGVLAYLARPYIARLGFLLPLAIGAIALWYFVAIWGGRQYVSIALFFLIAGFSNIPNTQSRVMRSIETIGDASYSIYLIHPIVFLIASSLVSKTSPPVWSQELIRTSCFAVIIGASLLTYRYFETPMIQLGSKFAALLPIFMRRALSQAHATADHSLDQP